MPRSKIITALDIGTNGIKVLVVKKNKENEFENLALIQEPVLGVRKGVVINKENVSKAIRKAIEKAKEKYGYKLDSAFVNIGGSHISNISSHGTVAVSRADRKISKEDISRVLQDAQTLSLPPNYEILDLVLKEFTIDGGEGVKEVIDMQGTRLDANVYLLIGFCPYKKNLIQAILDSDLKILDIIPSPVASAEAVLTQRQKELGVGLLEIGAGTSTFTVFEDGDLIHSAVFPIGSANITNDIAVGLKVEVDIAERIKSEFGSCLFKGNDKKEKIKLDDSEFLVFSRKQLSHIIEARVSEIFKEAQKELKKISKQGLLPAGIILTGGGAKLSKITELAKKEFKLPCKTGKSLPFKGLGDDPCFATACGLILYGTSTDGGSGRVQTNEGIVDKIKKFFQIFLP